MSGCSLRRFNQPESLRLLAPERLLSLLLPHRSFFTSRGVTLPSVKDAKHLDCEAVGRVLLAIDHETPTELVNALYHVNAFASDAGMDRLLAQAEHRGIEGPGDDLVSPADVALHFWLKNSEFVKRLFVEQVADKRRNFACFPAARRLPAPRLSAASVRDFETSIAAAHDARKRSRTAKVTVLEDDAEVRLIVQTGAAYRREAALKGGRAESVHFRPMAMSMLRFRRRTGALRINAATEWELDLYRRLAGHHLFGDAEVFRQVAVYTLRPLSELGADALSCSDVPELKRVSLVSLEFRRSGSTVNRRTIEKADDVFVGLEELGEFLPAGVVPVSAKFIAYFTDSQRPKPFSIDEGRRMSFGGSVAFEVIEQWLELRRFCVEAPNAALAGA